MTNKQIEALIAKAVAKATSPLQAQINSLGAQLKAQGERDKKIIDKAHRANQILRERDNKRANTSKYHKAQFKEITINVKTLKRDINITSKALKKSEALAETRGRKINKRRTLDNRLSQKGSFKVGATRQERFTGMNMSQNKRILKNLANPLTNTKLIKAAREAMELSKADPKNKALKINMANAFKAAGSKGEGGGMRLLDYNASTGKIKYNMNKKISYANSGEYDWTISELAEALDKGELNAFESLENAIKAYGQTPGGLNSNYPDLLNRIQKSLRLGGTPEAFLELVQKYF